MRNWTEGQKELSGVICNGCGRALKVEGGILNEGCFEGKQVFGYFSSMDGQEHRFDLCEECYQKMIARFLVPVTKRELPELDG